LILSKKIPSLLKLHFPDFGRKIHINFNKTVFMLNNKNTVKITFLNLALGLCFSKALAFKFYWSELIADTLYVSTYADALTLTDFPAIQILDERVDPPTIIGIQQIKKWRYIPVDQYIALNEPLETQLTKFSQKFQVTGNQTLVIDHLSLWYDASPTFGAARTLNGYTRLVDSSGKTVRDWQWELREKTTRKQAPSDNIAILLNKWMIAQTESLQKRPVSDLPVSPYRYRRQMIPWTDIIGLRDGYIVIAHLALDYPADQMQKFIRGSPGIYYRKSSEHESIAIGGKDQQWYFRLTPSWLARLNTTIRVGFNNFNPRKYEYVDFWNIMLVNLGFNASLEYRPVYHKGLFVGAGLHQAVNILPSVINTLEIGWLFSIGLVLP